MGKGCRQFVSDCHCNPKTIRNLVATLRMMWNSARAWGYVAHNPFDGLVLPKRGLIKDVHVIAGGDAVHRRLSQRAVRDVLFDPG